MGCYKGLLCGQQIFNRFFLLQKKKKKRKEKKRNVNLVPTLNFSDFYAFKLHIRWSCLFNLKENLDEIHVN